MALQHIPHCALRYTTTAIKVLLQKLSWRHIDFMIMGFIAKISLNLINLTIYSGLTVDYGEYFNLSVDFYLTMVADQSTECANSLHHVYR